MTAAPHPAPDRRERLRVALRTVCSTVALLVVYATLPYDRPTIGTLVMLAVGLMALAVVLVWQVRSVTHSPYPMLRAVESFLTAAMLFIVVFAGGYVALSTTDPASFSEPLNRIDGIYFTMTVLATVGFGDIVPVSGTTRVVATVQMVCGLAFVGLVGREFIAAVGRADRRAEPSVAAQAPPTATPPGNAPARPLPGGHDDARDDARRGGEHGARDSGTRRPVTRPRTTDPGIDDGPGAGAD